MLVVALMAVLALQAPAQRKITPVNTPATATQPINEFEGDTARINARMRATMAHYHDADGNVIYIDTITGREWRDSTAMAAKKKEMMYPLLTSASVSVDLWNPLMRAFGQHYGLIGFGAQVSLHNRYMPAFEMGLGMADNTPDDNNFHYKSPMSVYFRAGMDYNFLYNSTTDYQFFVGVRFGFSPFNYDITDISIESEYWGETAQPEIPTQHCTATWWEFNVGLQVKIWGPISAGWSFRYHNIMKCTSTQYGEPWYIPGYGARGTSISGAINITYTLPLGKKRVPNVDLAPNGAASEDTMFFPAGTGEPTPDDIEQGNNAENPL